MSLALTGKKKEQAEKFYNKLLSTMLKKKLPFMVSGTFAFMEYTGIIRETGDIDIKIPFEVYPEILKSLSESGYKTELTDHHWLAKIIDPDGYYTDLIWAEMNGLHKVESSWIEKSTPGTVLGHKVLLEPAEELVRSKCYVQNRHRHDSSDVVHLLLKQGNNIDWENLLTKMEPHWELLMGHILTFLFVYPSEREVIPKWVIDRLVHKLEERLSHKPTKTKITRGLLLSTDYEVGVSLWGFTPITDLK